MFQLLVGPFRKLKLFQCFAVGGPIRAVLFCCWWAHLGSLAVSMLCRTLATSYVTSYYSLRAVMATLSPKEAPSDPKKHEDQIGFNLNIMHCCQLTWERADKNR